MYGGDLNRGADFKSAQPEYMTQTQTKIRATIPPASKRVY
jgi:hypothetical protein